MQFFKRDMKILRPYLPSPWRTDHACLLRCLPLFIYSAHGDNPRTGHCSYRWTSHRASLTSHSSRLHPEALAGARNTGWKQTVASVIATGCTQDWLCVEQVLPSLCSSGAQAEDGRAGGFPWPVVSFFHVKLQAQWLSLTEAGQRAASFHSAPQANWNEGDLTLVPRQSSVMHLGTPTSLLRIPGISCIKKCF